MLVAAREIARVDIDTGGTNVKFLDTIRRIFIYCIPVNGDAAILLLAKLEAADTEVAKLRETLKGILAEALSR